ncbi:MAG: hypothetical protein COT73_01495 [Bdellovibrio sp. CG10_big_fil_rev_8_21_14_0_10_47_8]|nr:MAG: hypothetical protein COT73_01495 [Bdellovibrio sp. CG10_big_fil_rev_8_21_14_0_10_47_8]
MTKRICAFLLILTACSPESAKQYIMPVAKIEKNTQSGGVNIITASRQVDILFVVDDSGSMSTHQTNLKDNISLFTSAFTKNSALEYNIGVITTTDSDGGRLQGFPTFVTETTPDADAALRNNLSVGTSGSGDEKLFSPITQALSPYLLNGYNAGFLRADSTLAVIFITDAEDHSYSISAKRIYDFLLQLRNGEAHRVLGYGAIVPSDDSLGCPRDDTGVGPAKLEEFLSLVKNQPNNIFNLCAEDFGLHLSKLALDIVKNTSSAIYLDRLPYVPSIKVTYGKMELPSDADKGWSYDAALNAVILGEHIDWSSQPKGSKIELSYIIADPAKN